METLRNRTSALHGRSRRALLGSLFFAVLTLSASAQITAERTGWIMFDESISNELAIRDPQKERLLEIDRRYRSDYERLGDDPRSDPNYIALTERRNAEIQTVLDAEQYSQWMRINDYDHDDAIRRAEPGPAGSEMDRRDPSGNYREMDQRTNTGAAPVPKSGGTGDRVGGSGSSTGGQIPR